MVMTGLEPATPELLARCSNQLSYTTVKTNSSDSSGTLVVVVTQTRSQSEYHQPHNHRSCLDHQEQKQGTSLT